ncbi:ABC transporter substrate-binding protein [bacterium]|nr:ABC transporter substrate-binding protein [bacterium]
MKRIIPIILILLSISGVTILSLLEKQFGFSWLFVFGVGLAISLGYCLLFFLYERNHISHEDMLLTLKNLLSARDTEPEVINTRSIPGFNDIQALLDRYVQQEYDRIREDENQKAPHSILASHVLPGIQSALSQDSSLARQLFSPEISDQIRQLFRQLVAKRENQLQAKEKDRNDRLYKVDHLLDEMAQLVESVFETSRTAIQANRMTLESRRIASENQAVVNDTADAMSAINQSSAKIGRIIKSIDNIAFQTNLIALNASVEAARVGKAGQGFAVVAQEIRGLAQQAKEAAESTQILVTEIIDSISASESQVRQSTQAFNDLVDKSGKTEELINIFQKATSKQNSEIERIHISLMQAISDLQIRKRATTQEDSPKVGLTIISKTPYLFQTHWLPQAQFAGYYMALEREYYQEAGIVVALVDGGPQTNTLFNLVRGEIDFGTSWLSAALVTQTRGARLTMLAQIFQRSGLMLVAKKSSGIKNVTDLKKRIVSSWGGIFLFPVRGLDITHNLDMEYVYHGTDIKRWNKGEFDLLTIMSYNELFAVLDSGINLEELVIFALADHGFNILEDSLYTRPGLYQQDPGGCQAFIDASIRGWQAAADCREETLDLVMRHHDRSTMPTAKSHQQRMLDEVMRLVGASQQPIGSLNRKDFETSVQVLYQIQVIQKTIDLSDFYVGALQT